MMLSMCKFTCTRYKNRLSCIDKTILSLIRLSTYLLDLYFHFTYSNLKKKTPHSHLIIEIGGHKGKEVVVFF